MSAWGVFANEGKVNLKKKKKKEKEKYERNRESPADFVFSEPAEEEREFSDSMHATAVMFLNI